MSILDIFKTTPDPAPAASPVSPTPAAATPAQPGNLPAAAPASTPEGNGVVPAGAIPAEGAMPEGTPDSPLDAYKSLWDTPPTDPNTPPATPAALDPTKLAEIVNKADFSQNITPEMRSAIEAGGEGATAALMQALNGTAQQVMIQSTLASNKMIEQQVAAAVAKTQASLPEMVRTQTLNTNIIESNPVLSNPAIAPIVQAVQAQVALQNPNATPAELASLVQNTVTVMGEAMAPAPVTPGNPALVGGTDWEKFLSAG